MEKTKFPNVQETLGERGAI